MEFTCELIHHHHVSLFPNVEFKLQNYIPHLPLADSFLEIADKWPQIRGKSAFVWRSQISA